MQAFSPIFGARKTQVIRAGRMGAKRHQAVIAAVRQFLRPPVLAILAMAFVVGACGYGFKLNQYQHLFELSKPCAVRMWVEHREESIQAFEHHSLWPQKLPGTQSFALAVAAAPLVNWPRDFVLVLPAPQRPAFFVSSLIPFRAPPISHSSLA